MRKLALAGTLVASLLVPGHARAATCAPPAAGGEWRTYGHDLSNTRHQTDETRIGPGTVGELAPAGVFSSADAVPAGQDGGVFHVTPIVADGCVYVGSDTGWVFGLNADTLETVWATQLPAPRTALGGAIVGTPAVHGSLLLVPVNERSKPYVAALDKSTGAKLWEVVVDSLTGAFVNASAVVYDDLLFQGFAGDETRTDARGGFTIVELREGADQGKILKKTYTIPDGDYAAGYAGGSVWASAAVDTETGFLYTGGGNPASKRIEHKHTNALLKIDMRRGSATFGEILDAYKGNVDQYYPGLDRQPACALLGDHPSLQILGAWSVACLQLDVDFGASPNLFRDRFGHKLVGALQKSGVFHAAHADEMSLAWTSVVGPPCFGCNASSSATDGSSIFAVGTPPGQMVSLSADTGAYRWASPTADGVHFQPVATANGVVYTLDTLGFIDAFDAESGLPLLHRSIGLDVGESVGGLSSRGVAVARSTLYAAAGTFLVAYR